MSTTPPTSSNLTPEERLALEQAEHYLQFSGQRDLRILVETVRRLDAALLEQLYPPELPPEFRPTRQYFSKVDGCPSTGPNPAASPDCICWHDEGTGPYPDEIEGYGHMSVVVRQWRDKPPTQLKLEDLQKPTRQYFYYDSSCTMADHTPGDACPCWHDEGTGTFADEKYEGSPRSNSGLRWRVKPAVPLDPETLKPPVNPVSQLAEELQAVIHRYRREGDIELASYIGALEMVKLALFQDEVVNT